MTKTTVAEGQRWSARKTEVKEKKKRWKSPTCFCEVTDAFIRSEVTTFDFGLKSNMFPPESGESHPVRSP